MSGKDYQRDWHQRNKARRNLKIKENRDRHRAETAHWLRDLKETTPCADCGNHFPYYVMQFDHLGDKEVNIAEVVRRDWCRARVQAELDKCELVCANCHAVRTYMRRVHGSLVEMD